MEFTSMRVWFEKTGSARFISHLDLTRVMARAIKLSGLPVWYTEGFNPRIYMTFAMPLSLGARGLREVMDFRLVEEVPPQAVMDRLNERLPGDIRVLEAAVPQRKLEDIAWAEYEVRMEAEDSAALLGQIEALLARETISVLKHSKKGDREVDVKPDFAGMSRETPDAHTVALSLRLPCSVNGSVNPALLLEALQRYEGVEPDAQMTRLRLLTEDFSEIR